MILYKRCLDLFSDDGNIYIVFTLQRILWGIPMQTIWSQQQCRMVKSDGARPSMQVSICRCNSELHSQLDRGTTQHIPSCAALSCQGDGTTTLMLGYSGYAHSVSRAGRTCSGCAMLLWSRNTSLTWKKVPFRGNRSLMAFLHGTSRAIGTTA